MTHKKMHFRTQWLIIGALYVGFILVGSLIRVPDISYIYSHTDKIVHFLLYFILVGWFVQLYPKSVSHIIILSAAILMGLSIEYLQGMTYYRSFDLLDAVANSMGATTAYLLARTSFSSLLASVDQWLYQLKT